MARRDDLAYGELPQRWDRDRFERFGGRAPQRYEEDFRYEERDRRGQQDIAVQDRYEATSPRGRYEERDRFYEQAQHTPAGRRRRTDRELFGDQDPNEVANMSLMPYRQDRGKSATRREIEIEIDRYQQQQQPRSPPGPRPGLMRRQSSLDTFDRRPIPRYEREEHRVPAPPPPPVPAYPMRRTEHWERVEDYGPGPYQEREDYRDVEIQRERRPSKSVKSAKSSKAKSVTTRRSSSSSSSSTHGGKASTHGPSRSVHDSIHESIHGGKSSYHDNFHESYHESVHGGATSVSESIQETTKKFKKGKTRMPKRLVRREAVMDLGYPFDEEDDFYVLRIALEKEQIDEVMRISETYKNGEKKVVYKYEEKIDEAPEVPQEEREEVVRTEWINPPSNYGGSRARAHSHSGRTRDRSSSDGSTAREGRSHHTSRHTSHSRHQSTHYQTQPPPPPPPQAPTYYEERKTVIEEKEGEALSPTYSHVSHHRSPSHGGALVLQEREYRSDRDINDEIRKLESERRALRLEREADQRRDLALKIRDRPTEEYQLVEYDRTRPAREVLEVYDRDRSPSRTVTRVEKDRKETKAEREARRKARVVAAAMATLT